MCFDTKKQKQIRQGVGAFLFQVHTITSSGKTEDAITEIIAAEKPGAIKTEEEEEIKHFQVYQQIFRAACCLVFQLSSSAFV